VDPGDAHFLFGYAVFLLTATGGSREMFIANDGYQIDQGLMKTHAEYALELGAPIGAFVVVNATALRRAFVHATVVVDMERQRAEITLTAAAERAAPQRFALPTPVDVASEASRVTAAFRAHNAAGDTLLSCNLGDNSFRGFHFADLMKQALPFGQPDLPASQNASVDVVGWPTQDFSVSVYSEGATREQYSWPPARLEGVYTITARGNATLRFPANETIGTILNQTYDAAANLFVAFVAVPDDPTTNGGRLEFTFEGTARDPARPALGPGMTNVSVLHPGFPVGTDPEKTFLPAGLATYGPCKGTIRVMPWWLAISASASRTTSAYWANRARVGAPSYLLGEYGTQGPGAPWETMIAYVNAIGAAGVWANVPPGTMDELNATANDEYTLELLELLDAALAPESRIYLEWGNEIWNGAFTANWVSTALANQSVMERGDPYRLTLGMPSPPVPTAANVEVWAGRYAAWWALHMADIAATVVGAARVGPADLPGVRVVPVLGVHGSCPSCGIAQIEWLNAAWGSPAAIATLATDGYIDLAPGRDANWTVDEVIIGFESAIASVAPADNQPAPSWCSNSWSSWAYVGAYFGYRMHAYEGSPIHVGALSKGGLSDAYQDPRFAAVVAGTVSAWQAWHGGDFNWFTGGAETTFCPWGSNAVTWDVRVPDTPKMAGIAAVASSPPAPVTGGLALPLVNHPWTSHVGYYSANCSDAPPFTPYITGELTANSSVYYLFNVPDPATCALKVSFAMCNRGAAGGVNRVRFSIAAWMEPVDFVVPAGSGGCAPDAYVNVEHTLPPLAGPRVGGNPQVALRLFMPDQPAMPGFEASYLNVSCA
jgi:hypothetical protein